MGHRSKRRFSKVNIEISNICNLQCSFCPEVIRDKQKMDLSLFETCIQQVAPLTDQVCLHLMGEPLLHPNLQEMVDICALQTPGIIHQFSPVESSECTRSFFHKFGYAS